MPSQLSNKEFAVYRLIQAYRRKGHLIAKTNPIRERKDRHANLELSDFGLSDADLSTSFEAGKFIGLGNASLTKYFSTSAKMLYASCWCSNCLYHRPKKTWNGFLMQWKKLY